LQGLAVAVFLPSVVIAVHAWAYGRWIIDDAAITFAYARSVATGLGPVLQPGLDPVEGYSNPAWLALLVAARWLGLFDNGSWWGVPDLVAVPKLLGLLCAVGVFTGFHAIARTLTSRPILVTTTAGVTLACVPSWVIWIVSGLENGLLALAVTGVATVLVRAAASDRLDEYGPAAMCGLLAALAALTRPDGLIYAGAYPLAALVLLRAGRLPRAMATVATSTAALAVPVGLYLVWRVTTFGEILPNTALAKSQGAPGLDAVHRPVELIGYIGPVAALIGVGLVVSALARPWPGRAGLVALLVPLGLAVAAFAVLEPDWMGQYRFATPVWTLSAIAVAVGADRVLPTLARRGKAILAGVALLATAASGTLLLDGAREFRASPTVPMCLVVAVGTAVEGYADALGVAKGTVLAPDIGGLALSTRLQVVDLVGLADAEIAKLWRADDMPGLRDHVFDEVSPTMIVTHSVWTAQTGIVDDARMTRDYVQVSTTLDGSHWVRRDAVRSPAALEEAREFGVATAGAIDAAARREPRGSC
jgi:hypothetical protein